MQISLLPLLAIGQIKGLPHLDDMSSQSQPENSSFTLDCFYHQLPDRHQELFFQPPSSFSLHKLPIELRLMIWRIIIPRQRKIWLHPQKAKHNKTRACIQLSILPATQVCIESRQEIYNYLKISLQSSTSICITRLDVVRCDFDLLFRVDARHKDFVHLLGRRGQLVSQVRDLEIKLNSFSNIDELYLILSGDLVFERFVKLERLRLLIPAGADWKRRCEALFKEVCCGYWTESSANERPLLAIEEL